MNHKKRLLGIDLCRGIAAYAVVVVHSGDETWQVPIDQWAINFRLSFYFAVPFFLATSFYFLTHKPNIGFSVKFWKSRLDRLIIPYFFFWSIIYLILRLIFFLRSNQTDRLNQLIHDPLSIAFFGGASFHLYFLPLLLAGTFWLLSFNYFSNHQFKIKKLFVFLGISIIINELVFIFIVPESAQSNRI